MGSVPDTRTLGDLYAELGVAGGASPEEITTAYRARMKELHPDTRPADAAAAERFHRVTAAYRVLSDPVARARYDAQPRPVPLAAPPSLRTGVVRPRLSRRGARWCVGGGVALIVLGCLAGAFVLSLQRHDADLRARGVGAVATVVRAGAGRELEFTATGGRVVRTNESVKSGEEQPPVGTRVAIHYDRTDPTNIVTDESHVGRDVTLWIVAVKLFVGGAVLVWFGTRRLRRRATPPAATT